MKAVDFEYDGINLSDFGMIICNFGDKGLETISNGSTITFNTVPTIGGSKHELTSTVYENCLEATIQICKNSCNRDVMEISSTEFRELTRWLNRKKFLKFKILDEDYIDLYFEASFNINRIEVNGKLYGLELEVFTNRPFALKEPKTIIIENTIESGKMQRIYTWKKYEDKRIINENNNYFNNLLIATGHKSDDGSYYSWSPTSITYASQIELLDGKISLVNPQIFRMPHGTYTISEIRSLFNNTVGGKYISSQSGGCYKAFGITGEDDTYKTTMYIANGYVPTINIVKEFVENSTSENSEAYPIEGYSSDGYYYIYVDEKLIQKEKCSINDTSYEEGYIYPHTEITIVEDGDLDIYNAIEDRHTIIKNCIAGEVITMDYPIIQSSISSHNIQNDFDWNFFRVANTFNNSRNDLSTSIPCIIKITYSPIVKVGL